MTVLWLSFERKTDAPSRCEHMLFAMCRQLWGCSLTWVQDWVQLEEEAWLQIPRKRHQTRT
jgi:hypothetical protein